MPPESIFFSSRRRHTRWPRDWSSDVCSSDLGLRAGEDLPGAFLEPGGLPRPEAGPPRAQGPSVEVDGGAEEGRSEERRVGKEWRRQGERSKRCKNEECHRHGCCNIT